MHVLIINLLKRFLFTISTATEHPCLKCLSFITELSFGLIDIRGKKFFKKVSEVATKRSFVNVLFYKKLFHSKIILYPSLFYSPSKSSYFCLCFLFNKKSSYFCIKHFIESDCKWPWMAINNHEQDTSGHELNKCRCKSNTSDHKWQQVKHEWPQVTISWKQVKTLETFHVNLKRPKKNLCSMSKEMTIKFFEYFYMNKWKVLTKTHH